MLEQTSSMKAKGRRQQDASITEVAQAAGVSIATVSRVINQPDLVSAATRERVHAVMEDLHYRLNPAAAALRRGHGKTITVLAASLTQPWYTKLMRALKAEIEARGFGVMQVDLEHDPSSLRKALLPNSQQLPTGFVLATGDSLSDIETELAIRQAHESQPLVVIGQQIPDAPWPTVQFTDEEWSYRATKSLLGAGTNVAFLGRIAGSYLSAERLKGYLRAANESGVDTERWVWPIPSRDFASGFDAVTQRINDGEVPNAIFAINDELALGASRALLTHGLNIPGDVAVMGFGNTEFLDYVTPTLSSVDGSAIDAARVAVEALWAQFEDRPFDLLTVLDRTLVHRESTVPIADGDHKPPIHKNTKE